MQGPILPVVVILGAITAALAMTVLAWQQRPKPGAVPFALLMAAGTWWVSASAMGLFMARESQRLLLHDLRWLGMVVFPVAWLLFTLDYTSRDEYVTPRTLTALAVVPAITIALVFTNDLHGYVYVGRSVEVYEAYAAISIVERSWGPWFWVHIAWTYVLLGAGTLLVLQLVLSSRTLYRGQATALLITVAAPWIGSVIYVAGRSPVPNYDFTPFMFVISGAAGIAALTQFDLLDTVPVSSQVARDTVIERMDDGVVVVDGDETVVDINPQAADVLQVQRAAAIERDAGDLLPGYEDVRDAEGTDPSTTVELERPNGTRYYELSLTPLRDSHHGDTGDVVVIHDVTDRRNRLQQLDVLNRVLRHNLRNEMNVVYGFAAQLEDGDTGERIKEKAMKMVDLGDKAREIDRILHREDEPEPVDLRRVVEMEVQRARESFPDVEFTLSAPEATMQCRQTVGPVVRNLLENAAIHNTNEHPQVDVDLDIETDQAVVEIADNGPGIPDMEGSVLKTGVETPLEHSNGLGLWLVNWGVQQLGGSVTIEGSSEEGTTVRLTLPSVTADDELPAT